MAAEVGETNEEGVVSVTFDFTKKIKEAQYYLGHSLKDLLKIFDIVPLYSKYKLLHGSCRATTINIKKKLTKL